MKGYFGMMCKTYTTIIPSNEFKCLCIEAEGEGGQNFSVQDPRGGKNVAREFRGGGAKF